MTLGPEGDQSAGEAPPTTSYASYRTSYAHCTFILFDVASLTLTRTFALALPVLLLHSDRLSFCCASGQDHDVSIHLPTCPQGSSRAPGSHPSHARTMTVRSSIDPPAPPTPIPSHCLASYLMPSAADADGRRRLHEPFPPIPSVLRHLRLQSSGHTHQPRCCLRPPMSLHFLLAADRVQTQSTAQVTLSRSRLLASYAAFCPD